MHSGSGGTPKNVKDIVKNIYKSYDCYILISNKKQMKLYFYTNSEFKLIESWNLFSKWLVEEMYIEEFSNIYFYIFLKYSINIVHIHHVIYHSFDLFTLCNQFNIRLILSIHDFYLLCPAYTLLDGDYKYCKGNCDNSFCKQNCFIPMKDMTNIKNMKNFVKKWRENINNVLKTVDYFIVPSNFIKKIFCEIYSINSDKFRLIEHGSALKTNDKLFEIPTPDNITKILFLGNINIQKGSIFIEELYNKDNNSKLEFHFLGNISNELKNIGIYHGKYTLEDLDMHIKKIKPSFIGIFSICPESYCYTLSEAWDLNIPVFVSKIGALKYRLLKNGGGWFIDINDVDKTYNKILSVINDNEEYIIQQKKTYNIHHNSIETMSMDYLKIYDNLVKKGD